jgi:hypothetical protein
VRDDKEFFEKIPKLKLVNPFEKLEFQLDSEESLVGGVGGNVGPGVGGVSGGLNYG